MNELTRLEDQLLDIEVRVALLEACRPIGVAREEARLEALLAAGSPEPAMLVPRVEWPKRPSLQLETFRLEALGVACERLSRAEEGASSTARILAARAREMALDIQIVGARGTPELVRLARMRFVGAAGGERLEADRLARAWLEEGLAAPLEAPASSVPLAAELRRLIAGASLEIDVLEVDMAARAAVTERALLVRAGARVTKRQVARIFTHEVFGHWQPRRSARANGPPFRVGPRGADADEEGRALQLEVASGYMDSGRRLELGVRHLLAARVLDGHHPGEALAELAHEGVPADLLSRVAPRVLRAGGLCREIIYLPGLLRVGPRLIDPEVERVFRAGRVTLAEFDVLRALLGAPQGSQSRSTTTGV